MADKMPNYKLEIRRLHWQISQQQTAREACFVQMWEAVERVEKAKENLAAHDKAIANYQSKLTELEATHGTVSTKDTLAIVNQLVKEDTDG